MKVEWIPDGTSWQELQHCQDLFINGERKGYIYFSRSKQKWVGNFYHIKERVYTQSEAAMKLAIELL